MFSASICGDVNPKKFADFLSSPKLFHQVAPKTEKLVASRKRSGMEVSSRNFAPINPGQDSSNQWVFQVLVIGGRDYITPQKAIYKWYISGIYCQLGDYMPPTTF